ncbi:Calcium-dependent protein kinase 17 [Linum grandiflorum]
MAVAESDREVCYIPILETSLVSNLKEKYVLGEQLGWGQFGVIRVCTEKSTGELFACKSIAKDRLVTSDDIRSVKLEIEIMTKLSGHPNVVDLKAVYEDEDNVHLVMELCAGGELFHQLEKHGRFCEVEAKVLFKDLMQVVLHCHEIGVVHRDLKPENILLATKSLSSQIKLADFGLATYVKAGQSLHGTVGSPFYIAPEVLSGGYNQTADVWSAGVILYILLSGMPPFWGKTKSQIFDAVRAADLRFPSNLWDRVTTSAKELVQGMLRVDPLQRLTAQQVLEHSWMKDESPCLEETCPHTRESCRDWDMGSSSFSTLMTRNQDISFGANIMCEEAQSPTSTSRSSFSSFLAQPPAAATPFVGGFSFRSNDDAEESSSTPLEFASSPMSSMPSFAFFDPNPAIDQDHHCSVDATANTCRVDAALGEANLSLCCGGEVVEQQHKTSDFKRAGGTIGSRILGMHSKRNRTIGLGEREQLDLMVTESVIRWASCTNLPTASSLRSSLVC